MKVFAALFRRVSQIYLRSSVLSWSAAARVAVVVPLLALLWVAVWWASLEAAPL
jgi:hypothetical protein